MTHTTPELATIPAHAVVAVDGRGSANAEPFEAAVATLLENRTIQGTWWSGDDRSRFDLENPDGWSWTLAVPLAAEARVEQRPEQRVARLMHHGPYEDEGPSLAALYAFVAEQGLEPAGPHTETYLNDPATVAPADIRAELRVPVK
jgi:hypothetical protein